MTTLLDVKDLEILFKKNKDYLSTVSGVSFHVNQGEILGVVGESGCGKSVTSLSIMGLLPTNYSKIGEKSKINFNGRSLVDLPEKDLRKLRGKEIAMIFQDPMSSLNPVLSIGYQMNEMILAHDTTATKKQVQEKVISMLKKVGIPRAERIIHEYPHQLSGGMRQRIMIAMALSCNPKLLIADEPTTALDVTIQAQILDLIKSLQKEFNTAVMLITHDLAVVAEVCDRVIVMYAGKVVEEGNAIDIFESTRHPYTLGLLKSIPSLDDERFRLDAIPGSVPLADEVPLGCRFAPRCAYATAKCYNEEPSHYQISENHFASCWLFSKEGVN
jgi:peptide/nickel transport system ATP-binding protein